MPRGPYTSIILKPEDLDRLHQRGARPDRGRGPQGHSARLRRALSLFDAVLVESDPRLTQSFREEFFELVLRLLDDPWSLSAELIKLLPAYLENRPGFRMAAKEAKVDPKEFLAALRKLTFAELLFLVDQAELRHAPRSAKPRSRKP